MARKNIALGQRQWQAADDVARQVTLNDILTRTAVTVGLLFVVAAAAWALLPSIDQILLPWAGAGISTLVLAFVIARQRVVRAWPVLLYAVFEGVFIGSFSRLLEAKWAGIVPQAIGVTFLVAAAVLITVKLTGYRPGAKVRQIASAATFGLLALYLVNFVASLFGAHLGVVEWGTGAGWLSIGLSAVAASLAAFHLVLDFDYANQAIEAKTDRSEAWRVSFGFVTTLVWLYVEVLRILSYFRK